MAANDAVLALLKQKSNILNRKWVDFQTKLQDAMDSIMDSRSAGRETAGAVHHETIGRLFDAYSFDINQVEVECLAKCRQVIGAKVQHPRPSAREPARKKQRTEQSGEFRCDDCDIDYTALSSLQRHNRKNHADRAPNNDYDSSSVASVHSTPGSTSKLECSICHKKFKERRYLRNHMLLHGADRPFKCELCPSAFVLRYRLNTHMLSVHKQNPYACEACKRTFKNETMMETHQCPDATTPPIRVNPNADDAPQQFLFNNRL